MTDRKMTGSNISPERQRELDAFKETTAQKVLSDHELAKKAFDDNRERLKSERLARSATDKA